MDGKEQIRRLTFTATVRGRTFSFTWRDINALMGITEEGMNEWLYPESLKLSKEELEKIYDTQGKKVSGMSDSNRLLYYVYSRMMTHKGVTSTSSLCWTTHGSPDFSPSSQSTPGS